MKIGYACLTVDVPNTKLKGCILRNASEERLFEIIHHNLEVLNNMIDYNIEKGIKLFRISSNIIPFGSHPINRIEWWKTFETEFDKIGTKIKENKIRITMHPGQYTVLNSPNQEIVDKAIKDLDYHNQVLKSLGLNNQNKIVIHIGGMYLNKEEAMNRFIFNYNHLNEELRKRIVIENDDKLFNINDVLSINKIIKAPVVFDVLHNLVNSFNEKDNNYWIHECAKTWSKSDGIPIIHYSEQDPSKQPGAHSQTIDIESFQKFYSSLDNVDIDIMLEVKDKNISTLKCIKLLN